MSSTISLEEAQANLKSVIGTLAPGEEVIILDHEQPVAKLVGERAAPLIRPEPGLGRGSVLFMAPDFDEPLEEFKEYME